MPLDKFTFVALLLLPASSKASSEGMGSILIGYVSIYIVIPLLVLIPTIRLIFLSKRNSGLKKFVISSLAVTLVSLVVLFTLATQYFSFNFMPPYHNEAWESLYLLVLPSAYFWFKKGNKPNAT